MGKGREGEGRVGQGKKGGRCSPSRAVLCNALPISYLLCSSLVGDMQGAIRILQSTRT